MLNEASAGTWAPSSAGHVTPRLRLLPAVATCLGAVAGVRVAAFRRAAKPSVAPRSAGPGRPGPLCLRAN